MKIRKSSIAAAVATLAAFSLISVSTPAIAANPSLLVWVNQDRKAIFTGPINDWAKANNVDVTIVGKSFGTVRDALKTAVPAGTGPDVLISAPHDWTGNLKAAAVIQPLRLSAATTSQLTKASLQGFTLGNQLYGVPFWTENIALIRSLKTAPKAPTTAAGMKAGDLAVASWESDNGQVPYHFYPIQASFGAPVFEKTSNGWTSTLAMDGPEGSAFAQYLNSKGKKFFAGTGWDSNVCGIKSGKLKYWITGPWAISSLEEGNASCPTKTNKSVINKDFAVSAIPSFGGKVATPFLGVQGGFLTNMPTTNTVNGTQLLTYLAGKTAGLSYFTEGNFPPANIAALKVASANPVIKAFDLAAKNAVPMPNIVAMDSVWDKWGKTEAKILLGKSTNAKLDWQTMTSAIKDAIKN